MKFEQKKKPTLEKRDNILRGEVTEFDDLVTEYDKREPLLKEIVDGIQAKKSEEDHADILDNNSVANSDPEENPDGPPYISWIRPESISG